MEWRTDIGVGLIVCCLCLNLTHDNILGVGKLVWIQGVVLHGRCDEPDVAFFALNVQASAGVDGDVGEMSVQIVIS